MTVSVDIGTWNRSVQERQDLRAALRELEQANEALAASRPQAAYSAMIAAGQGDALLRLDRARSRARALLAG